MTLRTILLAGTALGAAALLTGPAFAGSAAATQNDINTMKQQIMDLQQRLDDLQISQGNELKEIKEKQDAYSFSLENGKPVFKSGDGLFTMSITGRAHLDFASTNNSNSLSRYNSGANFRRAELGVEGTFMKDWGYVFGLQFGGSGVENGANTGSQFIKNAYVTYNGFGKHFTLKAGAGELPYTLEYATSSNDITFIERSAAVNENISLGSDDGRVFVGAQGYGKNFFAAGFWTKSKTGETGTNNSERDNLVGRLAFAFQPDAKSNIHIGASGTYMFHPGNSSISLSDRPGIRTSDVKYINTGTFTNMKSGYVYGPEFAASYGPVKVQGEYYRTTFNDALRSGFPVGDFTFDSWYAQASWVITGESYKYAMSKAAYGGIKPASPFTLGGGIGAWEIAARYGDSDLNDGAFKGGHEKLTTLGLNWYVNNNVRFMLNGIYGKEEQPNGANTATVSGTFKAVAARMQVAF
jgi:phosphate-selective porin OprO/OprP